MSKGATMSLIEYQMIMVADLKSPKYTHLNSVCESLKD